MKKLSLALLFSILASPCLAQFATVTNTALPGDSSNRIASTSFVQNAITNPTGGLTFTGTIGTVIDASAATISVNFLSSPGYTVDGAGKSTGFYFLANGTVTPTLSNGNGVLVASGANGGVLAGKGSSNDISIRNGSNVAALTVPTGTTNVSVVGQITTGANGGTGGQVTFNGATSGSAVVQSAATGALVLASNVAGAGMSFNDAGNGTAFSVAGAGGAAANRIQVNAATTGNPPIVLAVGSDTNVNLKLQPQGSGNVVATSSIQTNTTTVGSLPTCVAGLKGAHSFVTDSNAASYTAGIGAIVATGGTTNVPVVCDGTNWRIG